MKVAVLFPNFGPYHLARLRSAEQWGGFSECFGLQSAAAEALYPWQPEKERQIPIETLHSGTLEQIAAREICRLMEAALSRHQPDAIAVCGYERPEMRAALSWANRHHKIAVIMSESKFDDAPRTWWKEALKRQIIARFDCALVGGRPHRDYLEKLGMNADRIAFGYDVVDNAAFATRAQTWREGGDSPLPAPYLLTVNRFVERKNLLRVIEAFALYRQNAPSEFPGQTPWQLVLCGDGPQADELRAAAQKSGADGIHFTGFLQQDEIIRWMAFASAFLHASLVEQWGLVVNEAMSCGLPLLVSETCGSASELLENGVNGLGFDPTNTQELARAMGEMAHRAPLEQWGENSRQIVAKWGPERFGQGLRQAIDSVQSSRAPKGQTPQSHTQREKAEGAAL